MDDWLKQTVLTCTPVEFGYDTNLWTSTILADLLKQEFGILHSPQKVVDTFQDQKNRQQATVASKKTAECIYRPE
jgi:hypothetical protein